MRRPSRRSRRRRPSRSRCECKTSRHVLPSSAAMLSRSRAPRRRQTGTSSFLFRLYMVLYNSFEILKSIFGFLTGRSGEIRIPAVERIVPYFFPFIHYYWGNYLSSFTTTFSFVEIAEVHRIFEKLHKANAIKNYEK